MTPEDSRIRATAARQLLENALFVEAFSAMERYLQMQSLACDSDNAQKALRIVISQQLLAGIKREFTRIVQDGKIAEVKIEELEQRKKFKLFQR